jgi:hypothetical protein
MYRAGIYIETPASEFLEWLEAWTKRDQAREFAGCHGHVTVGVVQRRRLLSQHLVVEVLGTLHSERTGSEGIPFAVSFHVLPVGLGYSVEVVCASDTQELFPYLVEFASAIGKHWPDAAATAWFGEPPARPVDLCVLRVPSTIATLEQSLLGFTESFATTTVRSVSFSSRTGTSGVTAEHRSRRAMQWDFRLSLHTRADFQGVDHITLMCDVSRAAAKRPLTLTLKHYGFAFQEIEPFKAALIGFCKLRWPDTRVSGLTNPTGVLLPNRAPSAPLNEADRPWEMITDNAWDRLLIELWWADYPGAEIARQIGVSTRTVINRLSELRKIYGKRIVPVDSQRRGKRDEKS